MLIPILCTCGKNISSYYEIFQLERIEKNKEIFKNHGNNVIPSMISTADELQANMGEVLDKMHMNRDCCRQKMLTSVNFHEF